MKKAFTLTETIVVIIIIGIISAILIPYMLNTYDSSKEQIIEIRNNEQETINIDIKTNEPLQDTRGYKLVNIEYKENKIICYWEKENKNEKISQLQNVNKTFMDNIMCNFNYTYNF